MIKIEHALSEEDLDAVEKKWRPIVSKNCAHFSDNIIRQICLYAEYSALNEIAVNEIEGKVTTNGYLEIALDIISKLDLSGKNLQISPTPNTSGYDGDDIAHYISADLYQIGIRAEVHNQYSRERLVEKTVQFINAKLKSYDTFVLYSACSNITYDNVNVPTSYLKLKFRGKFLERTKQFFYSINDSYEVSVVDFDPDNYIKAAGESGELYYIHKDTKHAISVYTDEDIFEKISKMEHLVEETERKINAMRQSLIMA